MKCCYFSKYQEANHSKQLLKHVKKLIQICGSPNWLLLFFQQKHIAVTTKIISCKQQMAYASVVKYELPLYFRQLCNSCMSACAFSPSLRSKLFPRSSPNPNECTHEKSKSTCTHIYGSQIFQNKANGLYLTTPGLRRAIQNYLLKVTTSTMLLHNHKRKKILSPLFLISGWASRCRAAQMLPYLLLCCCQD